MPDASNEEISKIPKANRGALRINFEFMPVKNAMEWGNILSGVRKYREDINFKECKLSASYLRYSRIDVNYYFGHWNVYEKDCSLFTLIKLASFKALGAIYVSIFFHKVTKYIQKVRVFRALRVPVRSKYEIYEALMNNDDFLRIGTFRKSELSKMLFGKHYIVEHKIYQKVSQSLDWILESCVEDDEVLRISPQNEHDPLYRVKGKGIHYFTLTKESIENREANKKIQEQQIIIQRRMSWLTVLLVIGTFMTAIDKWDKVKELVSTVTAHIFSYLDLINELLI